jgi:DNA recombination protein RmuC
MTNMLDSTIFLSLIVTLLVGACIQLGLLLKRSRANDDTAKILAELGQQLTAARTGLEMIDQRHGQLLEQFTRENAQLREQIADRLEHSRTSVNETQVESRTRMQQMLTELREHISQALGDQRTRAEEQGARTLKTLQDSMQIGFDSLHKQLGESLLRNATELGQRVETLNRTTDNRLKDIAGQVEKRLADGFEKTTATFTDIVRRLALIDEAQKKITALSGEVVSLQQLLADKRSRGAFGEVQLSALVANIMPPASYELQHTLPNERIADCALFLPAPTGKVCIDAKFPLESFRVMTDIHAPEADRKKAETQFKQDIKKHIKDISSRYILRDETADGAIMFIPAEAVFAEIQAHHPDLVDIAHAARVWLASPTTLWAILNTACAVLKDAATREQVDIIQAHLGHLADDFRRFRTRMDKLAVHIDQANRDVSEVNKSARKIADRFEKIERVELEAPDHSADLLGEDP